MAVLNNLYPPVIETYMPAFIVGPLGEPVKNILYILMQILQILKM